MISPKTKKIWIDLDNSPHVPFFKPIIEELEGRGYEIITTARECFQVCGLADYHGLKYKVVGRHHGKNKIMKGLGLVFRALQLAPTIMRGKPKLAVSHGSRAQLIAARLFGIPAVIILDYEYARKIPFINPAWVIAPEILGKTEFDERRTRMLKYPGIKEDVYIPNFKPDNRIKKAMGLTNNSIVVTIRPPATEAHYFTPESKDLFEEAIDYIGSKENIKIIMLPRNEKQESYIRQRWPKLCGDKIIIPPKVTDGLNLIWQSDLVISGGGTMNREAAALGVPVYSIFKGKIGAVDRYLSETGRLILVENKGQLYSKVVLKRRDKTYNLLPSDNYALQKIVSHIVDIIEQ
jgi:hypothetical protein